MAEAQGGSESAYRALVERHSPRLFAMVGRLLGRPEDVAEVCQDAFVKAYFTLDTFRGDAAFSSWVTGIALNLAKNRLRDSGRKGRNMGQSMEQLHEEAPAMANAALAVSTTPRDHADSAELSEALDDCLQRLEEGYREAFVLRVYQEMSYQEISGLQDVPVGTVKSRLNKARQNLRACLERKSILPHV